MGTSEIVALLLGIFSPVVTSLFKSINWPRYYKILLIVGVSAMVAVIAIAAEGAWTAQQFFTAWGIAYASSQVIYAGLFEKSKLEETLRKLLVK